MKAFLAIVKLTCRSALRSHVFRLLLLLLLAAVIIIPCSVRGSIEARDFFRVTILYSLSTVNVLLALSTIWLGCFLMSQDIDSYQLHMVVSKPVSRITIWLAKWCGVSLIHLTLLVIAALAAYGLIMLNYRAQEFPQEEKDKVRAEVLVGRRVFRPERPDYDEIARRVVSSRVAALARKGTPVDTTAAAQEKMLKEAKKEVMSVMTELPFGKGRQWVFKNLPKKLDKPLYFRYRVYVDKLRDVDQRMTHGWWAVARPRDQKKAAAVQQQTGGQTKAYELFWTALTAQPEQIRAGYFREITFPPAMQVITPDREVAIRFYNYDDAKKNMFFQDSDGPKLLIETAGFAENYARGILVLALELVILAGLACAFGGFLTMPTAVFIVVSYLLFGSLSVFMLNQTYIKGFADEMGRLIATVLLKIVIPLQVFDTTDLVSQGELVEFSYLGELCLYYLPRALALYVLGILMYRRRELGLIVRK